MEIYIFRGDQQSGPISEELVKSMLQAGMVQWTDLAWHQELAEWKPLHTILKGLPPTQDQSPGHSIWEIPLHRALVRLGPILRGLPYSISRLCAGIIDSVLILFAVLFGWGVLAYNAPRAVGENLDPTWWELPAPYIAAVWLIPILTIWLYFAVLESFWMQATFGKMAMGLIVTDLNGKRVTFERASRRVWGMALSVVTAGIGFLMCAWTQKRQSLHDILSGCLVLKRK